MIKYSLIIPFYNESRNISEVIHLLKSISKKINSIEFILVNNGSTDDSESVFKKNLKRNLSIKWSQIFHKCL